MQWAGRHAKLGKRMVQRVRRDTIPRATIAQEVEELRRALSPARRVQTADWIIQGFQKRLSALLRILSAHSTGRTDRMRVRSIESPLLDLAPSSLGPVTIQTPSPALAATIRSGDTERRDRDSTSHRLPELDAAEEARRRIRAELIGAFG